MIVEKQSKNFEHTHVSLLKFNSHTSIKHRKYPPSIKITFFLQELITKEIINFYTTINVVLIY